MSTAELHDAGKRQWLALLIAWTIVGVPTVWGVAQTVMKALALFVR